MVHCGMLGFQRHPQLHEGFTAAFGSTPSGYRRMRREAGRRESGSAGPTAPPWDALGSEAGEIQQEPGLERVHPFFFFDRGGLEVFRNSIRPGFFHCVPSVTPSPKLLLSRRRFMSRESYDIAASVIAHAFQS